jgi:hypothetical protein
LTAKNTLSNRFEDGEYFQFKSTFVAIVSQEMLKVDYRRVRLKVTAHLGRVQGATLNIDYTGVLNIFSIDKLNEALVKYLIKTPLKFDLSKSYSQIILSDNIFS